MTIKFENVSYQIPNGEEVFKSLNLELKAGKYYGLLGKNGAGKSTFIELVMGLRKLKEGKICILDEDVSKKNRYLKDKVFVVSHDFQVPAGIKVEDLFNFYSFFYPRYDKELEERLVQLFEINPQKKFGALSTGQKIKALLCSAFAAKAEVYLFDEVTAVLDPKSRRNFKFFLEEFKIISKSLIILATNIAEDIVHSADDVIFIDDGHQVNLTDVKNLDQLFEESA